MERPGLECLLNDIAAGKIAFVVVCKVRRLTCSLSDFARRAHLFDKHNVSFMPIPSRQSGRRTTTSLDDLPNLPRDGGFTIRTKAACATGRGDRSER
jgi:DNA invertase Pin-like site-specific DNA recombinase